MQESNKYSGRKQQLHVAGLQTSYHKAFKTDKDLM
jgi:hypothetical protein